MKLSGRENADWTPFKGLEDGTYNFVVSEGVKIFVNENSGKSSLYIPCKVAEGDSVGASLNLFFNMNKWGEQSTADLVKACGLEAKFAEKFPSPDVSFFDDAVVAALDKALPGKFFTAKVEVIKGRDGVGRPTMVGIYAYGKAPATATSAKAAAPASTDEDWDS